MCSRYFSFFFFFLFIAGERRFGGNAKRKDREMEWSRDGGTERRIGKAESEWRKREGERETRGRVPESEGGVGKEERYF